VSLVIIHWFTYTSILPILRDTNILVYKLPSDRIELFPSIAHYLTGPSPLRITPSQWSWESTFAMCSQLVCYATRGLEASPGVVGRGKRTRSRCCPTTRKMPLWDWEVVAALWNRQAYYATSVVERDLRRNGGNIQKAFAVPFDRSPTSVSTTLSTSGDGVRRIFKTSGASGRERGS